MADEFTSVEVRFYEELNDFLPAERRKRAFRVPLSEPRSVKDLIESLQVPHTEVDLILVDGESVGFEHLLRGGERVAVYPVFESLNVASASRLHRPPLRAPRFLADVHLGALVRRLRLLGFDCLYEPPWDDAILAQRSASEQRILLTRDRRLLMRAVVTHGVFLHSDQPDEQMLEVVRRLDLRDEIRPLARCSVCNGRLAEVRKEEVRELIPPKTWHYTDVYYQCRQCRKLYWKGTHWPRLRQILDRVLTDAPPENVSPPTGGGDRDPAG